MPLTLHLLTSLDGYIAKKDGNISWMSSTDHYEQGITLTDADIEAYLQKIDCYVMGSRTYEHAQQLGWPYGDTPTFVLTHRPLKADRQSVEFYAGALDTFVREQLKPRYQHIWLVGGAMLAQDFLRRKLVDEIVLSVMPVILGDGLRLFEGISHEIPLHLKEVTAFRDGMVELYYEIR